MNVRGGSPVLIIGAGLAGLCCARHLTHALPGQPPEMLGEIPETVRLRSGLFICGDHRENATINGAMVSGRRAAEAVLQAESVKAGDATKRFNDL